MKKRIVLPEGTFAAGVTAVGRMLRNNLFTG